MDALAAAEFVVRHMYRPIEVVAGQRFFAVAETEHTGEDSWFWNDDNAKTLEFLSRPEIWRRFPEQTGEVLRFVRSMCHGPFIFRRVSQPLLEATGTQNGVSAYRHSLMQLNVDLSRAAVVAGVRFHDERNLPNLMFSGNYVEFTYRNRRFKQTIGPKVSATEATQDGHTLRLRHSSDVYFAPRWKPRRLGRITYLYVFDARSMLFDVEAVLDLESGTEVSDVVLTIGNDALGWCFFTNVVADTDPDRLPLFAAGKPGIAQLNAEGAGYYSIRQGHISADALAVHSIPNATQRLSGLETVVEIPGRLGRVLARYAFPGRHNGARLIAAEHKVITSGGFYDRIGDYAAFIRQAVAGRANQAAAYDLSISYDYGVTLNAFAKCFAVANAGELPHAPPVLPEELRGLIDHTFDHYFDQYVERHERRPNAIFSRELAFVMLAAGTMYRATGSDDYRRRLGRLCEVLLDFEVRFDDGTGIPAGAFLMRKDSPRAPYVDCHSGSLLALTLAARHIDDPRLAAAIDRGIASYGLETCRLPGATVDTIQALMIDEHGERRTENAYWNFKAGLTLRFFGALRASENPALQPVAVRHRDRMDVLDTVMRHQLARSLTRHEDGVEIRCSVLSAETNSESQPWIMLGLLGHPWD